MTANDILFRCSSLGHLVGEDSITEKQLQALSELQSKPTRTEKQEQYLKELIAKRDSNELSKGVITHLVDVFASAVYSRREEAFGKSLTKGIDREEDSITLLSLNKKSFYQKNTERLKNEFIQGEPDLFTGESIHKADHIIDIKTSWSFNTFLRAKHAPINKMYFYQVQGYMDLTGAKSAEVTYCLVNNTTKAIDDEKRKTLFLLGGDEDNEEYKESARQIEINHIFDLATFRKENPLYILENDVETWNYDIPMAERVFSFKVDRDQKTIDSIHKRVVQCRQWMETNLFATQLKTA